MRLQLISDNKGNTAGVFIPIQDWNELKNQIKELQDIELCEPTKEELLAEIRQAIKELQLIEQGKLKSRPVKALLDEL